MFTAELYDWITIIDALMCKITVGASQGTADFNIFCTELWLTHNTSEFINWFIFYIKNLHLQVYATTNKCGEVKSTILVSEL